MTPSHRWLLLGLALGVGRCTLTQSLDDLRGGKGGTSADASPGGSGGSGGAGAGGGTGGSGGTLAGGAGGGGGTGGATGGAGGSGGVISDPCWLDAGTAGCSQCCVKDHQQGYDQFVQSIQTCVCLDAGTCAAACSSYCVGGALDAVCSQCVSSPEIQNCIGAQCSSSECKDYFTCIGGCPS